MLVRVALLVSFLAGCGSRPQPLESGAVEAAIAAEIESDRLGLLLDLGSRRLDLHHGGVLLRSFAVSSVEIGRPRWTALSADPRAPAPGPWIPIRRSPTLRREARVVPPPADDVPDPAGGVDWVPPRPAELNPDPPRVWIAYADGLALDIRADDAPEPWRFGPTTGIVVRLRMPRSALGSLHRALPDSVPLLIIAPSRR